ncbi:MAG TPA: glycosyltransferase [Pyrinomonadaceae bacterium]|jgi:glycosyltransferase involved in cell wall biosynthesis|nr:glycosyltransferase [Pyrinomonadaceae bacterium]
MRLTMVIGGLGGGGAERVCINLANCLVKRGDHVTLLTIYRNTAAAAYAIDSRVQRRSVDWPRLPRHHELNAVAIAPILRGLQQAGCVQQLTQHITFFALLRHCILAQNPDVVVSHMDITNLRVLVAMYETNVPVIACEHTDATRVSIGWWQNVRAALLPRACAVVTPHPKSAEWLSKYGVKVATIPNPLIAPNEVRVERNGHRRRLIALSRLSEDKRPDLSIRAFAKIAGEFPEWDFEIYGDGPMRATVARLIEQLAPGRIRLRGFTEKPYDVLRDADLFVSTSWVEGFGNSIWEAMACGVPVVVTEAGTTIRALVRDGIDGVISNDTVAALAKDLATLMRDDGKRAAMAGRAREVVNRFSLEASLAAWDKLLAENVN